MQTGEAPNENTLYRIYSLTKLYTAVAALQLIEQKKLRLDAAVADYIPEYKYLNVTMLRQMDGIILKKPEALC